MLSIAAYGFLVVERCLFSPAPNSPPLRAAGIQLRLPACPAALPTRTERHNPHSIASVRRQIATHLARSLPRYPCCLPEFL